MVELSEEILKEIKDYCKNNDIDDINKFLNDALKRGFWVIAYDGTEPTKPKPKVSDKPQEVVEEVEPKVVEKSGDKKKDLYGE